MTVSRSQPTIANILLAIARRRSREHEALMRAIAAAHKVLQKRRKP